MVVAAQVAEISVAAEKRRLLLEVQRCNWCRWLMLSVRRKRGVTCGRDGGNPSPAAGLSLLTIAGEKKRDKVVSIKMWTSWSQWKKTSHDWAGGVQLSWVLQWRPQ
ncbi:hypothetical protein Peur_048126 [Populus x canadensis]